MKREFPPVYLALILVLGCVVLRVLNNAYPDFIPNISPLMAIAFVGAMYLPRKWGWLVGPATLLITDLAFVRSNAETGGSGAMFSSWTFVAFAFYAAAGGFGLWLATRKSLTKIITGSLLCSLLFYVVSNTYSFWFDLSVGMTPGYPATWAGWWQANTVGLPGLTPTWTFLRNGMAGDLFFALVLLLVLDRSLLFGQAPARNRFARGLVSMMPLALSTCWNSYRHQDGFAMLKEIRQLGFPAAELGHAIRFSLWPGIIKAWEEDLIKIQTLHNFCPVPTSIYRPDPNCYEFSDPKPAMRNAAIRASEDTIRNAAKFGAKVVVFHLGTIGPEGVSQKLKKLFDKGQFLSHEYTEIKVKAVKQRKENFREAWPRIKECLVPLVNLAGELKVRLGFEIREDFEEFPHEEEFTEVLDSFPADVVGYWHDFGHSQRKEFFGWHDHFETLSRRSSRMFGAHIHDCRRPQEDHLPLGHGEIAFRSLLPLLPENAIGVLELMPGTPEEQVIASRHLWNSYVAASG